MSKKLFSESEMKTLSKNRFVKSISERGITYTDEFKALFIVEHGQGKMISQIFTDTGFDVESVGNQRIWCASKRWRKAYKESGETWLGDTRKFKSGRPLARILTTEEIIAKKDAEIACWKAYVVAGKVLLTDITYLSYGSSITAYL